MRFRSFAGSLARIAAALTMAVGVALPIVAWQTAWPEKYYVPDFDTSQYRAFGTWSKRWKYVVTYEDRKIGDYKYFVVAGIGLFLPALLSLMLLSRKPED